MRLPEVHVFTRLLLGAAAAALCASVFAQTGPAGHWEGTFKVNDREIGLALDLARNTRSEWIASMGVPSQNATGLVVTDLAVIGDSVKFVGVELMMSRFDLTLAPDGTMKGTISSRQGSLPVEFKRTGEAKVQLIPPSPAVSKELEGDWEGSLQTPNRTLRVIFHFKNLPDKTVAATIDTPDTGAVRLPLNEVKQTGRDVEFGIRIAHASFKGKLNPEGTELAGQFTHEQENVPLTLRKK
ncbi:MAG: hypothetical protein ACE15B_01830 [Bryobacteraceae bacterium]